MSKGGLGGGGGVSTPVMSIAIPPTAAAAIMLPVLCVMDLAGIKAYLNKWDRRILAVILPAGVAGCALGALTFRALDENWIRILVGIVAPAFLAYSIYPKKFLPEKPSARAGGFPPREALRRTCTSRAAPLCSPTSSCGPKATSRPLAAAQPV